MEEVEALDGVITSFLSRVRRFNTMIIVYAVVFTVAFLFLGHLFVNIGSSEIRYDHELQVQICINYVETVEQIYPHTWMKHVPPSCKKYLNDVPLKGINNYE